MSFFWRVRKQYELSEALTKHWHCPHPVLRLPGSWMVRNKFLLLITYWIYGTLIQQLKQTIMKIKIQSKLKAAGKRANSPEGESADWWTRTYITQLHLISNLLSYSPPGEKLAEADVWESSEDRHCLWLATAQATPPFLLHPTKKPLAWIPASLLLTAVTQRLSLVSAFRQTAFLQDEKSDARVRWTVSNIPDR